jgi:hypothetical protein
MDRRWTQIHAEGSWFEDENEEEGEKDFVFKRRGFK